MPSSTSRLLACFSRTSDTLLVRLPFQRQGTLPLICGCAQEVGQTYRVLSDRRMHTRTRSRGVWETTPT